MGLAADLIRSPGDTDIIGAYYRLLKVEQTFPPNGPVDSSGGVIPHTLIIYLVYKDKATRDSNPDSFIKSGNVEVGSELSRTQAYQELANSLGVPNVEV